MHALANSIHLTQCPCTIDTVISITVTYCQQKKMMVTGEGVGMGGLDEGEKSLVVLYKDMGMSLSLYFSYGFSVANAPILW